jgi:hypothetical protein
MTAEETATCPLVRGKAEKEGRGKGTNESKGTRQEYRQVDVCMIKFS